MPSTTTGTCCNVLVGDSQHGAHHNHRERKFAAIEAASEKMHKDSVVFRDAVTCKCTTSLLRVC